MQLYRIESPYSAFERIRLKNTELNRSMFLRQTAKRKTADLEVEVMEA
jgi:hypothetical protein